MLCSIGVEVGFNGWYSWFVEGTDAGVEGGAYDEDWLAVKVVLGKY